MVGETTILLLALGALALLGIFLLLRRVDSGSKLRSDSIKAQNDKFIERLLKEDSGPTEAAVDRRHAWAASDKATEQMFRTMFSTAADKGEGLIEYYMTRHRCGRLEAMRLAIEEREREAKD